MKASKAIISKANKIVYHYTTTLIPISSIQKMYQELEAIGITTGILSFGQTTCEWYYLGEEVENSLFCYKLYKPEHTTKVEFTIYFS